MAKLSKSFMAGWLQGFADGEGYMHFANSPNGGHYRSIELVNTDDSLVKTASEYLQSLGIAYHIATHIRKDGYKPIHKVTISGRDNLIRWHSLIGFAQPDKQRKLEEGITSYKLIRNRYSSEQLRELYLNKKFTQNQIADLFGQGRSAINYWLMKFGLQRRLRTNEAHI